MIIDYKEIPKANTGSGLQDTFELFARDFLEDLGFKIINHPDRGADGKKDLIVEEERNGIGGKTVIRWLVSCKHFAHSGKSVSDTDEPDIKDRLESHKCTGFIGVYSTIPATSLSTKLNNITEGKNYEYQIYDRERIEKYLLGHNIGLALARRYFPISIEKYISQHPKPASLFNEETKLKCEFCGKNLLETKVGVFVSLKEYKMVCVLREDEEYTGLDISNEEIEKSVIKDIYISCKDNCDSKLKDKYTKKGLYEAGSEEISNLLIPTLYLNNMILFINDISDGELSKEAINKTKQMFIDIFPYISRHLTEGEKEKISNLVMLGFL